MRGLLAMADPNWKSRVGIEINLSSSEEDDIQEKICSLGLSVPVQGCTSAFVASDVDDAPLLSPSSPVEYDLDDIGGHFLEFGRTPPRTRIARHMKDKRHRDSGDHHNVHSRSSSRGHRNRRHDSSNDVMKEESPEHGPPEHGPPELRPLLQEYSDGRHRRKRSLKLLRESERDLKLDLSERGGNSNIHSLSSMVDPGEDRAESMPTPARMKVETYKRFMSLAQRMVMCVREGVELGPRMHDNTQQECPQSRVDFYNTFSLLIRMGNPDRQEKNCRRQLSKEETRWQSEFKDMIWLELQAWLADRTITQQDMYLCEARKDVGALLAEIATYRFDPASASSIGGTGDSGVVIEASACNCLSMYCSQCLQQQNIALQQVEGLLCRLEAAVALYPSSKAMAADHAVFSTEQFTARLKALCLWYNMTRLHRLKVGIIGKLLHQLRSQRGTSSGRAQPWPRLDTEQASPSPSSTNLCDSAKSFNVPDSESTQETKSRVHFRLSELDSPLCSASPSESNSSTSSAQAASEPAFSVSSSRSSLEGGSLHYCNDMPHLRDGTGQEAPCGSSPYRAYIEDVLKSQGLKRAMLYLDRLHQHLLSKAHISLDKQPIPQESNEFCDEWELRRYGHWSAEAQSMALPTYRSAFLFLARIALDLVHEYLRLRLEQKPCQPSPLSIRQLMREMKEGLKEGVKQRQRYVHLMRSAMWEASQQVIDRLEQDVADFDRSMKCILEVYLEYLQQWVLMVQKESVLVCPYQKTLLEEEWRFVKATCPFIPGGEALAANSFCRMASGMLGAIVDHLNSGVDGLTSQLDDNSTVVDTDETNPKQAMLSACRGIQLVFHEARERALRAIAFAKTLRKDLEIASSFSLLAPMAEFLLKLWEAGHVRVVAPHSCSHLMFVPACLKDRPELVCRLVNMNLTSSGCGEDRGEETSYYLVLAQCENVSAVELCWQGETISIQPTAETTITLSHVEVQGVLLVVCDPSQLCRHRRHLAQVLDCCVVLTQESLPSNYTIAESLSELKFDAVNLRDCVTNSIQEVERRIDVRDMTDMDTLASRSREILHQCYKFGFEYNKEVSRLITGTAKAQLARGMIEFAKLWMHFVGERCERGRGLRPRWANQGLDFLMTACEPDKTKFLTDKEFEELKNQMDACISHVIGSAEKSGKHNLVETRSRGSSPAPPGRKPYRSSRSLPDRPETPQNKPLSSTQPVSVPGTPELLDSPLPLRRNALDGNLVETIKIPSKCVASWCNRVKDAVTRLEQKQDTKLRSGELIGSVTSQNPDRVHIKAKAVTFSWQRGIKIGQGRFGKVYTAVNNATGELMAMKEISFQPNDHRAIRSVAEELHIFEGIHHKHLIKYYGVEIHREEMLIFMEYCEEGTLESLVAATTAGLPEQLVRSFTRQLLLAVSTLHQHGIVHRDIKSANIFLTDEGNCLKLGDFGSAVKIKAHTTMPGELQGFVGTQAYMAPEVFMKSNTEGHGRAADIWSVGCVVVEMASGKRPWHEYDSNYQIMFKVGMGEVPVCPNSLSEEGHAFLDFCLQHDPRRRASADELLEHTFVKVELENDEESEHHHVDSSDRNDHNAPEKKKV